MSTTEVRGRRNQPLITYVNFRTHRIFDPVISALLTVAIFWLVFVAREFFIEPLYFFRSQGYALNIVLGFLPGVDILQDIVGARLLFAGRSPYPVLGDAFGALGIEWRVEHPSSHPPTAFLLVAPLTLLAPTSAVVAWGWITLALAGICIGVNRGSNRFWIYPTAMLLVFPPFGYSFGQLTVLTLLAVLVYLRTQSGFVPGALVGVATLTKLFPAILLAPAVAKRDTPTLVGFVSVIVLAIGLLLLVNAQSVLDYLRIIRPLAALLSDRPDNISMLNRALKANFLFTILYFLGLALVIRKALTSRHQLALLCWSYLSVVLLPVAWVYSLLPLIPAILHSIRSPDWLPRFFGTASFAMICVSPGEGPAAVPLLTCGEIALGIALVAINERD